jgi:hypothetical protein
MTMKQILVRIAGISLIVAGIAGLIFSIAGLFVLASVERQIEATVDKQVEVMGRTLATTAEGLAVAEASLAQAVQTIESLEATMSGVGQTIQGTAPTLAVVAELLGDQVPATIETTQETLTSVASSAKLVDDVLLLLTAIPLLGLERYNPEVPLNEGFLEVASSLDGIPDALGAAQEGLITTMDNLAGVEQDFAFMAQSIGDIATSLAGAQSVLVRYQGIVRDLQDLVSSVRQSLPGWLQALRLALSLVLVWLGIAQIALITQGWELIGRSRTTAAAGPIGVQQD